MNTLEIKHTLLANNFTYELPSVDYSYGIFTKTIDDDRGFKMLISASLIEYTTKENSKIRIEFTIKKESIEFHTIVVKNAEVLNTNILDIQQNILITAMNVFLNLYPDE